MDSVLYNEFELLELFMEGLTDPVALKEGLKRLEREFDAANAQLTLIQSGSEPQSTFTGYDQAIMDRYSASIDQDIWLNRYLELNTQKVMRGSDLVSRAELDASEFKANILKPMGISYSLGAAKCNKNGIALMAFQHGSKDFTQNNIKRLEYYCQHLKGFFSAAQQMRLMQRENYSLSMLADRSREPALIVDTNSHVICINKGFEENTFKGIKVKGGQLWVRHKPLNLWLEEWPRNDGIRLITHNEKHPISIERVNQSGLYLITIFSHAYEANKNRLSLLRARYDLTKAECQLVSMLAKGMSLEDAGNARKVSYHTIRNQLRSIFLKTDVHTQNELLILVS
ncbi:hypothetical protein MIB92_05425 [Aestuariirhabdus sp. Z084]|uniref:helix-turn-helix transcriptional regulator n=1 Tax=Aestuariirhabdus haliotis TaxID=2918751 RepID=UPI00201B45B1|nr:hypothetical protein [Aestuariirhabdus haliotis]MCL6415082.1 hypothetical protein [Aestuariirhabdus haliotis]MCL6419014.1 hypothetical protein [Aestuariirhabdus haliotis]